ncbi:MAG: peptidylprolyl isomerase [Eubacterium sp.]|nr:peptidylprolyl isomerase [Eubacterium sp.]
MKAKEKDLELENKSQAEENTAPDTENAEAADTQEIAENAQAEPEEKAPEAECEDSNEEAESKSAEEDAKDETDGEDAQAESKENDDEQADIKGEDAQAESGEDKEWEFEASAPTLEGNLEIGSDYEIEVAEESKEDPNAQENEEAPKGSGDEIREYKQEPAADDEDDDEEEKVKKNFIINKKALKIAVIAVVCAAVAALIAFFGIRYLYTPNSNEVMTPGNLALTVGNQKISVGYYNYYYNLTVNNYIENAQSGYLDLKVDEDYSNQFTTDDDGNKISWEQKFRDDTIWQIQYLTAYYEAALEAGVELTDEQKESIESSITNIQNNAAQLNKSVKEFLIENAGEYCGIKTMRTIYERLYLAQSYFSQKNISLSANEEEIKKAFEDNKDEYRAVSFAYIEMPFEEDEDIEAVKAKAKAYCKRIKSVKDMEKLIPDVCGQLVEQYINYGYAKDEKEAVKAIADSMQYTFTKDRFDSWFASDEITEWAFSSDTAVGSIAYFVDTQYSCIDFLFKLSKPVFDETELYSVRHILIMPHSEDETEENGQTAANKEYTKEEWAKAEETAQSILEEYNASDKTEIAFAELAEKYSEDTASNSAGGYGNYGGEIAQAELGQMVPEFEAWATDSSRKYGDVGIVKSQYGYHIMFFIYDGPSYIFSAKADADQIKQDEFIDGCVVTEHSAMDKTTVAVAE